MRVLVVNGPNLNLLGKRETEVYGRDSLWDLENRLKENYKDVKFEFFQSNHEGSIIDTLQKAMDGMTDGVVLNAGAYSHTSYAIRDCIRALPVPVVEVHISNIHSREEFRHTSVTAEVCAAVIAGMGLEGYGLAVEYLLKRRRT